MDTISLIRLQVLTLGFGLAPWSPGLNILPDAKPEEAMVVGAGEVARESVEDETYANPCVFDPSTGTWRHLNVETGQFGERCEFDDDY